MTTRCWRSNASGWGWVSLGVLVLGLLPGCASVRNDHLATPADPATGKWAQQGSKTAAGLIVSAEEKEHLASEYFGVVDVAFENTTDKWIRVKGIALKFGPEYERYISIPVGEQLKAWATATQQQLNIRRHNRDVGLAAVAIAGMTTAAVSNNRAVSVVGASVAAGSLAGLGADSMSQAVEHAEQPATPQNASYYESHLLSVPFSIPPGLFAKRWVTINTAGGENAPCVRDVMIDYELEGGPKERVHVTFRSKNSDSEWQTKTCVRYYPDGTRAND